MSANPNSELKISQDGLDLIKHYETFKAKAYQDPVGVWTIGWGTTGPDAKPGRTITKKTAEAFLRRDLEDSENDIKRMVKVPLTQHQFDALVSINYNMGATRLFNNTDIIKLINRKDYIGAAGQFQRHVSAKGQVFKGLINRRSDEYKLFMKPSSDDAEGEVVEYANGGSVEPDATKESKITITELVSTSDTAKALVTAITSLVVALSQLLEPLKDNPVLAAAFAVTLGGLAGSLFFKYRDSKRGR